jgi:hypothetical protein
MFYFDLETSVYSEEFAQLICELEAISEDFKYFGSSCCCCVVFRGLLLHMTKHECIEGDDMIVYLHFTLMLISITVITFVNSNEIISNNESWIMTLAVDLGSLTSLVYVEC